MKETLDVLAEEIKNIVHDYAERANEMHHPDWRDIATVDSTQPVLVGRAGFMPVVAKNGDTLTFQPTHWMPLPGLCEASELLALRRQENAALAELAERHSRALAYMAGEPVEPKTHFAEVVVRGVGGAANR